MMPLRLFAILFLFAGAQEPVPQLVLSTKDGHVVVGVPSFESLKIENSLGTLDLSIKKFTRLKFEGENVTGTSTDGTSLKGKLQVKSFKVKSVVGDLELAVANLKEADVRFALPGLGARAAGETLLLIRTKDGNDLVGTTDLRKIPFESSLGTFELDVAYLSALTRTTEPQLLTLQDGTQLRGKSNLAAAIKVKSSVGEFSIKPDDISLISFRGIRPTEPAAGPSSAPAPSNPAPAGPAPAAVAFKPVHQRDLQAVLGDLRVSKDGKRLYAIDLSAGKLCRWKLPGLEEDGAVSLAGSEKALSFNEAGDWAVAAGQNSISVLSLEPLSVKKTFAVEVTVEDVYVIDRDLLLVTGPQGTVIVSVAKTAVVEKFQWNAMKLVPTPQGDRIYCGNMIFQVRRESGKVRLEAAAPGSGIGSPGAGMSISPDGRFAYTPFEPSILRLGKCWIAARSPVAQLERSSAAVFSKDSDRLFLFTDQAQLKVIRGAEWKVDASHFIGIRAAQAVLEPDGTCLVVAGWQESGSTGRWRAGAQDRGRPVNLYRFEVPK